MSLQCLPLPQHNNNYITLNLSFLDRIGKKIDDISFTKLEFICNDKVKCNSLATLFIAYCCSRHHDKHAFLFLLIFAEYCGQPTYSFLVQKHIQIMTK
jgi:hypothetical protein